MDRRPRWAHRSASRRRSSLRTWVSQHPAQHRAQTWRARAAHSADLVPAAAAGGGVARSPLSTPIGFQGRRGERPGWWAVPPDRWEEPGRAPERAGRGAQAVLLEAISRLPSRQREVITLRDLSGWSADEVCNALGLQETNQRVLLHEGAGEGPRGARGPLQRREAPANHERRDPERRLTCRDFDGARDRLPGGRARRYPIGSGSRTTSRSAPAAKAYMDQLRATLRAVGADPGGIDLSGRARGVAARLPRLEGTIRF